MDITFVNQNIFEEFSNKKALNSIDLNNTFPTTKEQREI
jgi:hypothetical protein